MIPEGSRTAFRSEGEQQSECSDAGMVIVEEVFGIVKGDCPERSGGRFGGDLGCRGKGQQPLCPCFLDVEEEYSIRARFSASGVTGVTVLSGFLPVAFFSQKILRQDRLGGTIPNSVELGTSPLWLFFATFIGLESGVVSWFLLVRCWVAMLAHGFSAHLDAMSVVH